MHTLQMVYIWFLLFFHFQSKCDFCNLPYKFIAKSEDFERDDMFILEQIGIQDQIEDMEVRVVLVK